MWINVNIKVVQLKKKKLGRIVNFAVTCMSLSSPNQFLPPIWKALGLWWQCQYFHCNHGNELCYKGHKTACLWVPGPRGIKCKS